MQKLLKLKGCWRNLNLIIQKNQLQMKSNLEKVRTRKIQEMTVVHFPLMMRNLSSARRDPLVTKAGHEERRYTILEHSLKFMYQ